MIYKHEWEVVHSQLKGFNQATGLELQQKVFKLWKLRIVTDVIIFTGGEYTRKLRKRLAKDEQQELLEISRKNT